MDSMHRIKQISFQMLQEKMQDSVIAASDTDAKRDIMSLLVRARKSDKEKDGNRYAMSDAAMMDQTVRSDSVVPIVVHVLIDNRPVQLTFLGAGHETTASGLTWVCSINFSIALWTESEHLNRRFGFLLMTPSLSRNSGTKSHLFSNLIHDLTIVHSRIYSG